MHISAAKATAIKTCNFFISKMSCSCGKSWPKILKVRSKGGAWLFWSFLFSTMAYGSWSVFGWGVSNGRSLAQNDDYFLYTHISSSSFSKKERRLEAKTKNHEMAIIKQLKKERQIVIVFTFTKLSRRKNPRQEHTICFNACLQITFQFPFVF